MADIIARNVGKQFAIYHEQRPKTVVELFKQRWHHLRPVDKVWSLRDVDLTVKSGEMVGIVGANGAGKSTLLRLLGGVGRPDEGTIYTSGLIGAIYDLGVGFHDDLTGRENLYVGGVISGMSRRQVSERLDDIVAFAEAESYIDHPLRTYSSGMKMRLAFSIAAHINPEILLIDEVLAVGDLAFQQKCLDRINSFKNRGCAVLLVSHDDDMVEELCDRVIWMRKGRVAAEGEAAVVVNQYRAAMEVENRRLESPMTTAQNNRNGITSPDKHQHLPELNICAVRLLNEAQVKSTTISSGEPVIVEIDFHAKEIMSSPIFVVTISRKDGLVCYEANNAAQETGAANVKGHRRLRLQIDRLDLKGGEYFIDVGAFTPDWFHAYDYLWHVCLLTILSESDKRGIIQPPHSWKFS